MILEEIFQCNIIALVRPGVRSHGENDGVRNYLLFSKMQAASLPRLLPGSSIRCIFGYRQQQSRDEPGYCYDNSLFQIRIIIYKMVREMLHIYIATDGAVVHMEKCFNEFSPRRSSC